MHKALVMVIVDRHKSLVEIEAKVPLSQQLNLSLSLQHLGKYHIQPKTLLLLLFQLQAL